MRVDPTNDHEADAAALEFDDPNGPRVALWITPDGLDVELDDRTLVSMRGRVPRDLCRRLAGLLDRALTS